MVKYLSGPLHGQTHTPCHLCLVHQQSGLFYLQIPEDTKPLRIIIITSNNEQSESQTEHTFTLTSANGTFDRHSNYYNTRCRWDEIWQCCLLKHDNMWQHCKTLPLRLQKNKRNSNECTNKSCCLHSYSEQTPRSSISIIKHLALSHTGVMHT